MPRRPRHRLPDNSPAAKRRSLWACPPQLQERRRTHPQGARNARHAGPAFACQLRRGKRPGHNDPAAAPPRDRGHPRPQRPPSPPPSLHAPPMKPRARAREQIFPHVRHSLIVHPPLSCQKNPQSTSPACVLLNEAKNRDSPTQGLRQPTGNGESKGWQWNGLSRHHSPERN